MAASEFSTIHDILADKQHNTNADVVDIDRSLLRLVVFCLDGNWFALPGDKVRELLAEHTVSHLPGCPASLEGVINVRGDIESVISLRTLFQFEPLADPTTKILIVETEAMRSGVRVDTVEDIVAVPEEKIKKAPSTLPGHMAPIVTGVVELDNFTVTILDIEKMFADYRDGLQG